MAKVALSILAADFSRLYTEIKTLEKHVNRFHLDVMDGHFVPNITFGFPVIESIRKLTRTPLEAHLMIEKPSRFLRRFAGAGADMITVHIESEKNIARVISSIRSLGKSPALAISPGTPANRISPLIGKVDMVLVMTAHPGFAGQKFMDSMLPKIRQVRKMIDGKSLEMDLGVDCGINLETAKKSVEAGANLLVSSSYIYKSRNPVAAISSLKRL